MSGRPRLPLEIGLLLISIFSDLVPTSLGQIANESASCTGDFAPLNAKNGDSPCATYKTLQIPCSQGSAVRLAQTACTCNIVAYNLGSACILCGNQPVPSWRDWAVDFGCVATKPDKPVYTPPSQDDIPKWAFRVLPSIDSTFDENAAIQSTKSGWTPIQIVLPVVSFVAALLVAALGFYYWRRSKSRPRRARYWQDARLQGPRRFFGLFPDILRVRKDTVDTLWEIDEARLSERGESSSPPADHNSLTPPSHAYNARPLEDAVHSRSTSLSSLLPDHSPSESSHFHSHSSSSFSNFFSMLSGPGGQAKYKKGVAKAPEYKRVNVQHEDKPSARFKIDGDPGDSASSPVRGSFFPKVLSGDRTTRLSHAPSTLPSVLDIRFGGRGDTSSDLATTSGETARARDRAVGHEARGMQELYGAEEENASMALVRPPRSDFTLTTNDLMTPTEGAYPDVQGSGAKSLPPPSISVRADSEILPATPTTASPLRVYHSALHLTVSKPNKQ